MTARVKLMMAAKRVARGQNVARDKRIFITKTLEMGESLLILYPAKPR